MFASVAMVAGGSTERDDECTPRGNGAAWRSPARVWLVFALTQGCACPRAQDNRPASAPPDASSIVRGTIQSETQLVRVPCGADECLVLAYNDSAGVHVPTGDGWTAGAGRSRAGYAISRDLGLTWERRDQLAVPPTLDSLQGDPSLAAARGSVHYVSMADGVPTGTCELSDIVVARLAPGAVSFGPVRSLVHECGPTPVFHDGPKLVVDRAGQNALLTWWHQENPTLLADGGVPPDGTVPPDIRQAGYLLLDFDVAGDLVPVGAPADIPLTPFPLLPSGCVPPSAETSYTRSRVDFHPVPAAGVQGVFYVALTVEYSLPGGTGCPVIRRRQVIRLARTGPSSISTQRIVDVEAPDAERRMLAFNPAGETATNFARSGERQAIVVARSSGRDVVLVFTEYGQNRDGIAEQRIAQYRVSSADSCDLPIPGVPLCSVSGPRFIDADFRVRERIFSAPPDAQFVQWRDAGLGDLRHGAFAFQPSAFVGGALDDGRVGVFWYSQPFHSAAVSDDTSRLTTIEGLLSGDAGSNYAPILSVAIPPEDGGVASVFPSDGGCTLFPAVRHRRGSANSRRILWRLQRRCVSLGLDYGPAIRRGVGRLARGVPPPGYP